MRTWSAYDSPAHRAMRAVVDAGASATAITSAVQQIEIAALAFDFGSWWARDAQRIDDAAPWRSHGYLCGRGWGKTVGNVAWLVDGVIAGRIRRFNLIGPTDDEAYVVGFEDPFGGLFAWSPPWCRPQYRSSLGGGMVTWPNGAECRIYGAYKPSRIRGGGIDAVWCTELQSWFSGTAIEAWDMAVIKTREGRAGSARIVWDATSEARNELLADRLRESQADPERYALVRGDMRENTALPASYVRDTLARYTVRDEHGNAILNADGTPKLTSRGENEIAATFSLDATGALWRAGWLHKQPAATLRRRVISVDPAFSAERGSDAVGICDAGLDVFGKLVVLGDHSARMRWEEWGDIVIDLYLRGACDCIVVERNKGGDAVAANIRARALASGSNARVIVLPRGAAVRPPAHRADTIYVREITALDAKWNRAEPVASLYEAGLAYHDTAADLWELERTMTTWEPGPGVKSPNALDALTQAANELVDLDGAKPKPDVRALEACVRTTRSLTRPTAARLPIELYRGGRSIGRRGIV